MREYELTIIYDLSVTESGGTDASVDALTAHLEARGGRLISADRWGRRRMAYPINGALDGDYIVSRVELDADSIQPLQDAFRIDERIYRALVVRADELPPPPPPREPRRRPEGEAGAPPATEAPATEAAESSTTPSTAEVESVAPESSTAEASSAGGNEPGDDADENSATDTVEDETSAGTVEDETSAGTVEDETSADTVEDETSSSE